MRESAVDNTIHYQIANIFFSLSTTASHASHPRIRHVSSPDKLGIFGSHGQKKFLDRHRRYRFKISIST